MFDLLAFVKKEVIDVERGKRDAADLLILHLQKKTPYERYAFFRDINAPTQAPWYYRLRYWLGI